MSDEKLILYNKDEHGVATLTLNRPDKLNAFTPEMIARWIELLAQVGADESVKVHDASEPCKRQCQGVVGHLLHAVVRHVRHLQTEPASFSDVDVVSANSESCNHAQVATGLKQIRRYERPAGRQGGRDGAAAPSLR